MNPIHPAECTFDCFSDEMMRTSSESKVLAALEGSYWNLDSRLVPN